MRQRKRAAITSRGDTANCGLLIVIPTGGRQRPAPLAGVHRQHALNGPHVPAFGYCRGAPVNDALHAEQCPGSILTTPSGLSDKERQNPGSLGCLPGLRPDRSRDDRCFAGFFAPRWIRGRWTGGVR
jgi:hypothetical protein